MKRRVHVLNGPNLNMLGIREPHIYGTATLSDVKEQCERRAAATNIDLSFFQSNHEGELVELIQNARTEADAIVFNPAGYSFTSIAILDALKMFPGPIVELHISNIHRREEIYQRSLVSKAATAVIAGLGARGYAVAVRAAFELADAAGEG